MGERKVAGFLEIKEQRARHVSNSGEAKHIFTFNIYEIVTQNKRAKRAIVLYKTTK